MLMKLGTNIIPIFVTYFLSEEYHYTLHNHRCENLKPYILLICHQYTKTAVCKILK
jgi:hypothetical protein